MTPIRCRLLGHRRGLWIGFTSPEGCAVYECNRPGCYCLTDVTGRTVTESFLRRYLPDPEEYDAHTR